MRLAFVAPSWLDDPAQPSGGNRYGQRVRDGLRARGWTVTQHDSCDGVPDGALTLLDGLLAAAAAAARAAARLRLVVLLHQPLGDESLRATLAAARAVIVPSAWAAGAIDVPAVVVAPGVDPAPLAPPGPGGRLLTVGAVARHKGHDVLLAALARQPELRCRLDCAGPVDADFVSTLPTDSRVRFLGPLDDAALARAYAEADVLVQGSRGESYGLAMAEALARGVPVIAADVGAVAATVGAGGLLVPPDDPAALAAALRRWLTDPALRDALRAGARVRRAELPGWDSTIDAVEACLRAVAEDAHRG